ncbi:MAG TPA: sulfotransferase [Acidimicrobiales bacterium]
MQPFQADQLIAAACEQAGLDDFGSDSFREGLAVYCDALSNEAQLNELGLQAVRNNIVGCLVNRLRVVDWSRRHPEVADERIDAPIIVVGMFRAGTTFLSYLLDQDRANRPLLRWEAHDSVPPPSPDHLRDDPRIERERASSEMLDRINPRIKVVQSEEPDGPTECITVMSQDFKSLMWEALTNVPSYGKWLLDVDQVSAYEYHRSVLQLLQSGGARGRWTLKSPHHAIALEALTTVYPDARLVLMHRDPLVLAASVCSLIRTLSSTFSDADHGVYIAVRWTDVLEESIRRVEAFRAAHPDHLVVDVQYADLVRDPLATMQRLYAALGEELSPEALAAMRARVEVRPKGKFGTHNYTLAEFGLDGDALAERYAGYIERYDIPREWPRS